MFIRFYNIITFHYRYSREPAERDIDSTEQAQSKMNEEYGNNEVGHKYQDYGRQNNKCSCRRYDCCKHMKEEIKVPVSKNEDFRYRSDSHERGAMVRNYYSREYPRSPQDNYQQNLRPMLENSRSNEDFRSQFPPRINEDKRNRIFFQPPNQPPRGRPQTQSTPEVGNRTRSDVYRQERFPPSSSYVYSDFRGPSDSFGPKGDNCKCRGFDDVSDNECEGPSKMCKYICDNRNACRRCCCDCEFDANDSCCR